MTEKPLLTSHHMDTLWVRMAEIYGHKWVSSFGEKPNYAWTVGLENIPPTAIKYGIEAIINSGDSWPPSLPEFVDYCSGIEASDVISEVHRKHTDRLSTYTDIAMAEKRYFKEVKNEMVQNNILQSKQEYLKLLSNSETKSINKS